MDLKRNIEIGIGSAAAKGGAKRVNAALESIKRKSRRVANSGARDTKRMAKGFRFVSAAAIALAAVLAGKQLISSQVRFGQAISDLSAITGAVGKDLDFLRQKSKEFGETTTLSATQAAEAFRIIASAKPDLLESVDALALVTKEAIALAEATGDTLPVAANVMAASLNQFGEGADQASRFVNVLAAGSKRGAAVVSEMGEALKFAGIIASQAGLSFEETNAALQLMSTRALKGGEAGTQFRGVLLSLTAQSRDDLKPEIVGLNQALENLAAAGLDEGKEALDLFGRRNLAAAKTLIQNRAALSKLTDQLTGSNVAYEQQAIRVDNLSGDIKALKSAYEGLQLTIGGRLNGALRVLTQAATENVRALSKNPLLAKGVSRTLDFIHRVLQDIGIAFDQISTAVKSAFGDQINDLISQAKAAFQGFIQVVKFLWDQFVIFGPANLKLGFTLMLAAADRFKIGFVETVRIAFLLILQRLDSMRITFGEKVDSLKKKGEIAFTKMGDAIEAVFDRLKLTISSAIDAIIKSIQRRLESLSKTVANLGFDDIAAQIANAADSLGTLATFEDKAREAVEKRVEERKKELKILQDQATQIKKDAEEERRISRQVVDELIAETEAGAEVKKQASRDAVAGAIAERDATILVIEALRTKRKEIEDGAASESTPATKGPAGGPLGEPAEDATDAYDKLGDVQKNVVDNMADGISEFAAQGKLDFKDFANSVIQDLIRIQIRAAAIKLFAGIFNPAAAIPGVGVAEVVPTGGGGGFSGFKHGGSFRVGGSGGPDSQRVTFKASPDEIVSIKTPQQQRAGGRGNINLTINQNITADGSDSEKFFAQAPLLLERARKLAVQDVIELNRQGVFQTP